MKQTLTILTCAVLLTSCATISNSSYTTINVHTTQPSRIAIGSDTFGTINNRKQLRVPRADKPYSFTVLTDSLKKKITLDAKSGVAYYANILCNYGIGMLFDRDNPKRYRYPANIYLNSADSTNQYYRYSQEDDKGQWDLVVSLPYINSFLLRPDNESSKSNTGFWGARVGINYHYANKQFLNLSVAAVSDFFAPVPAAIDISGEYEMMSSLYLSLSNNHVIHRFSLGYGLSYARNTWDFRYYKRFDPPPPTRNPVKKSRAALGLIFSSYYQMSPRFNIGMIYRPTLLTLSAAKDFQYEHLISLDLAWKIRLKK